MHIVSPQYALDIDPGGFVPFRGGFEMIAHPMVRVGANFDYFDAVAAVNLRKIWSDHLDSSVAATIFTSQVGETEAEEGPRSLIPISSYLP